MGQKGRGQRDISQKQQRWLRWDGEEAVHIAQCAPLGVTLGVCASLGSAQVLPLFLRAKKPQSAWGRSEQGQLQAGRCWGQKSQGMTPAHSSGLVALRTQAGLLHLSRNVFGNSALTREWRKGAAWLTSCGSAWAEQPSCMPEA